MAKERIEMERGLVRLCIEAATDSKGTVEKWRRQRRTLERMPFHLAQSLLSRLFHRRLVSPSLLEVFQHSIEDIDLKGESFVDAEWMAYLGAFRHLRTLNIADCRGITNSALWSITGMTSLKELDLSRCSKITDAAIEHLVSIPNLTKLCISETGMTTDAITRLSSLKNLCFLDLGGLPVTDLALSSLQVLKKLEYLDLWGSKISNKGVSVLKMFPNLSFLNIAWTNVTKLPNLPFVTCLNMSRCTIESIFEGRSEVKAPLSKLLVPGATFIDVHEAFSYLDASQLSFLDISGSLIVDFRFLFNMDGLEYLDLSFSKMDDNLIEQIASFLVNLRDLNLGNTRVSSRGIANLPGNVPNLKNLSLSHTAVDDVALSYISMIPSLRVINLSNTNIKGFTYFRGHDRDRILSLTALQSLDHLESLNLEDTLVRDEALHPLRVLRELDHLALKSDFLSDMSLHILSYFPKLKSVGIQGSVLSNDGLLSFKPPAMLQMLDIRECWLLTGDAIVAFCKKYPSINVRHELVQVPSADPNVGDGSPPLRGATRATQSRIKRGKLPRASSGFHKENFIDQRIKYSREQLLELQFLGLSLPDANGWFPDPPKL
ncbi:leucine-rich repeat (LRR) family protein isoform X2 [Tasmannia lanceolata]|uniref:leucine-rich repeat (LRR) family protein isoform X2 n=1 Tax=Tasmannia lanceolata TaxID=3420 RepID=UPI004064B462